MVGFFYMIYDFPCIINKPSFYVIDVHAVLIVKDITGTNQYQHYHLSPPPLFILLKYEMNCYSAKHCN